MLLLLDESLRQLISLVGHLVDLILLRLGILPVLLTVSLLLLKSSLEVAHLIKQLLLLSESLHGFLGAEVLKIAQLCLLSFEFVLSLPHSVFLLFELGIQFLVLLCGHLQLNSNLFRLLPVPFAAFIDLRYLRLLILELLLCLSVDPLDGFSHLFGFLGLESLLLRFVVIV